jgi:O-antigen/teichoic acid export membrane protein
LLRIIDKTIQLARIVVVARILSPEDFGLLGVALFTMAAFESFSQTGFDVALIQKNRDIGPYLATAWIIKAFRGLLLSLAVITAAPYIAFFFAQPDSIPVMRVASLSLALRGFASMGLVCRRKELEFREVFIVSIWASLTNFTVTILVAFLTRNVWALVFGLLAGEAARTISTYTIHPFRPSGRFDFLRALELYRFGRWVFARNLIDFFNSHVDDLVVAKLLGVQSLGLYQVAYRVFSVPLAEIQVTIAQVIFPAYSKLQADLSRLRKAYLDVVQVSMSLTSFVAAGVIALGPELIWLMLGEKWLPVIPVLKVLAATGLLVALTPAVGPLMRSLGRPDINVKIALVHLIVMISLVYPLSARFGIVGTAWAVLISVAVAVPLHQITAARALKLSLRQILRLTLPSLTTSLVAVAVVVGAKFLMARQNFTMVHTVLFCLLFFLAYLAGLFVWRIGTCGHDNTLDIIKRRIKRFLENDVVSPSDGG